MLAWLVLLYLFVKPQSYYKNDTQRNILHTTHNAFRSLFIIIIVIIIVVVIIFIIIIINIIIIIIIIIILS